MANNAKVKGVYLWGPVGRGKTWLMNGFYHSLSQDFKHSTRRLHFHHFMRWVHQRLFQLTGQAEPLTRLAQELAADIKVLCLDELYVNDIGDAMLVGPLLQQLFAHDLVLIVTSNQAPENLYENGFNRERLFGAINALNHHLHVLSVEGEQDHRLHPAKQQTRFWVQQPTALAKVFKQLTPEAAPQLSLCLGHRKTKTLGFRQQVLWCRYSELCEQPLSSTDFIELCDQVSTILLSDVPKLSAVQLQNPIARGTEDGAAQVAAGERSFASLSRQDDGVRRFIALVDECYDRHIPLYISAAVPLTELYAKGALAFAFRRTLSRLKAMQFRRFGQPQSPPH